MASMKGRGQSRIDAQEEGYAPEPPNKTSFPPSPFIIVVLFKGRERGKQAGDACQVSYVPPERPSRGRARHMGATSQRSLDLWPARLQSRYRETFWLERARSHTHPLAAGHGVVAVSAGHDVIAWSG